MPAVAGVVFLSMSHPYFRSFEFHRCRLRQIPYHQLLASSALSQRTVSSRRVLFRRSVMRVFVMAGHTEDRRLLWLGAADWLVLLAGVAVAGLATLLFLVQ